MVTDRSERPRVNTGSLIDPVDREVLFAELRGRLAMVERYHGLLQRMEHELSTMQRLGKRLNQHFRVGIDEQQQIVPR